MSNTVKVIIYIVVALLALSAIVGLGVWLTSRHYQPVIDKLNDSIITCGNLKRQADAAILTQNNAITALQMAQLARGKAAGNNVAAAGESARDDYRNANSVLSESVTGHDVCVAASSAFDAELNRERAK
jgi:cell division protein FtsB